MSVNPSQTLLTSESRRRAIARLQILWKQRRGAPDGAEESRALRLQFISAEIGREVQSSNDLTDRELLRVLDALDSLQRRRGSQRNKKKGEDQVLAKWGQPSAPSAPSAVVPQAATAEIIHLASVDQVQMINDLFVYLGWNPGFEKQFLQKRFQKPSPQWLTHPQAHSAIRILLGIAAHKWLKHELGDAAKISREQIAECIPRVKQALREQRINIVGG